MIKQLRVQSFFDGAAFHEGSQLLIIKHGLFEKRVPLGHEPHTSMDSALWTIDCGGGTVLPAFCDCHTHFLQMGLGYERIDASQAGSLKEFFGLVQESLTQRQGDYLVVHGWDESIWPEARFPTLRELDAVTRRIPIIAYRVCGHAAVVNSPALELYPDEPFLGDKSQGLALEESAWRFEQLLPLDAQDIDRAVTKATQRAFELGVTVIHDVLSDTHLEHYIRLDKEGKLPLRISLFLHSKEPIDLIERHAQWGYHSDSLQVCGVKIFLDGSLGAHTAALTEPYRDKAGERGELLLSDETLGACMEKAAKYRVPLMLHAIGDRAVWQAVHCFNNLPTALQERLQLRIEHAEVLDERLIQSLKETPFILCMQPNFARRWSIPRGMNEQRLGSRIQWCNAYSKVQQAAIPLVFGSDCMPFDPLFALEGAVNHPQAALALPLEEALRAHILGTLNSGDFFSLTYDRLKPGMEADFVVLNEALKPGDSLKDVEPVMTLRKGNVVWKKGGSFSNTPANP